jgi:hypothetical protein
VAPLSAPDLNAERPAGNCRAFLLVAPTLLALAGPAKAEGPFDGYWSLDPEWCGNDGGQTDLTR